jgi:hypothetical protein
MSANTVDFAIDDADRPRLQILIDYFGDGSRAEFLRVAIERMTQEMRTEKKSALHEQAREKILPEVFPLDENSR